MAVSNDLAGVAAYTQHSVQYSELAKSNMSSQSTQNAQANAAKSGGLDTSQIGVEQQQQASLVSHLFGEGQGRLEGAMKLTFQATIEQLNEALAPDLGEKAISQEKLKEQGIEYWNVENTAERIFSGAKSFMPAFEKAHPDLEGEALMDKYMEVVGGGLQKGFDEAKGILGELKVFEGNIADTFQETMDRVFRSMENFRREQLGLPPIEAAPEEQSQANAQAASDANAPAAASNNSATGQTSMAEPNREVGASSMESAQDANALVEGQANPSASDRSSERGQA